MTSAPALSEHVIGYRCWRVRWNGRLISAGRVHAVWLPGVNTAVCLPRRRGEQHGVPAGDCSCGLYAFHDPPPAPSPGIVGAIRAHGNLQAHPDGFRAQHAEIVALVQRGHRPRRRERRAAGRYKVPLVRLQDLENAAAEHGQPLALDQRPALEHEILDALPRLVALHTALGRSYGALARRLRRRPRVRSAALAAVAWAPTATMLMWGYLAATRVPLDKAVWLLAGVPTCVGTAVGVARFTLGSGWLRPVRRWPMPVVLLLAVPLQFADLAGVTGLAVGTFKWAVGITAFCVLSYGVGRLSEPLVAMASVAWLALLGLVAPLVSGHVLLVLAAMALAQYALLFPADSRRLLELATRASTSSPSSRGRNA